jgi:hypothetical protein
MERSRKSSTELESRENVKLLLFDLINGEPFMTYFSEDIIKTDMIDIFLLAG